MLDQFAGELGMFNLALEGLLILLFILQSVRVTTLKSDLNIQKKRINELYGKLRADKERELERKNKI